TQPFTFVVSSPSGFSNLSEVFALFNTSVSGVNACYIRYNRWSNLLYLADNSGANWSSGFMPGDTSGSAGNSYCSISGNGASFSTSDTQLTVTVPVTFQASFSGVKNEYLTAYDQYGLHSEWQPMGAWTVPSGQQQYYLTTAVSPSGGGTISPASGWYNSGAVVTVSATANPGYQFSGFSGSLSGMANPQNLTITGTSSVTANFQAVSVPDFSLLSRTGSRILAAGRSGQYTVSVQPINGFAGTVSFSASGLPYGATASFNPPSIIGSGSTTVTVSTTSGSVTNNPISITITGTSGSLTRSTMPYLTVNPPGYSIYPAGVEVNLSALPVDRYFLSNDDGSGTPIISHCPVAYTIRQCIAKLFNNDPGNPIAQGPNGVPVEWNNWVAQGVTGVRFFFGVAGGFWSTPYVPNSPPYSPTNPTIQSGMQPEAAWVNNLGAFFQDLRTYGIQRVTPTPVMGDWGWPHGMILEPTLHTCGDPQTPLYFLPFLPFGLNPTDSYNPDRSCSDQSYQNGQSPATPDYIFWGWDRFFNLLGAVVSRAASSQLIVNSLDYYQETNMADFTVEARMVYDNTRGVDVVASLQDIMGWYHDNVFSGIDPLGASPSANGPEVPTPVTDTCVSSHYGDSGQLLTLSALVAALKGNKAIGSPAWVWPWDVPPGPALPCGSLASAGTDVPVGRRLFPSFIDIHTQKSFNLLADMADWSKNFHSRMYEFVSANGLSGKRVVFGETNPIDPPECNDPWTKQQAETMLYGIPGSENGFANSDLFLYYAGNVVMRPWQDITQVHSACMAFPNTINPPFNPME
ncbi:MAG: hypothetical protein HYS04_16840, partial [Acidobacteria bacterium]|nr:hypothetical protein [Acidobacteriota bacterium]